jgi:hypothetical protein
MRLAFVAADRHVFNGQVNGRPLRLLLGFEDGWTLRLGVAGDGFRMTADGLSLDGPFELEAREGVVVEDVTRALFAELADEEVRDIRKLELAKEQVGVKLLLGNGDDFHFWVDDDELFWGGEAALMRHEWLDNLVPVQGSRVKC